MEKKKPHKLLGWLLALLLFAPSAHAVSSVTVMADSSMSTAISALARSYSKKHQVVVNTSFAPQITQQVQIIDGVAVDVVITPKQSWINELKTQGLVDINSQMVVARGRLALVGPADTTLKVAARDAFPTTALITRMNFEPGFVVGYPENLMEGVYGKEALRNLGAADDIEPYTLYVKEREQMFSMVENQGNYGLFFYASALGRRGVQVLALVPENAHKPIDYFGVAIAGENMKEARDFLAYIKTKEAADVLSRYGFSAGS